MYRVKADKGSRKAAQRLAKIGIPRGIRRASISKTGPNVKIQLCFEIAARKKRKPTSSSRIPLGFKRSKTNTASRSNRQASASGDRVTRDHLYTGENMR